MGLGLGWVWVGRFERVSCCNFGCTLSGLGWILVLRVLIGDVFWV